MVFLLFIAFIILLRIGELFLSKSNERWLIKNGAIEYGQKHYPYIVSLHVLFLISCIVEYYSKPTDSYSLVLIISYFVLLIFKSWVIITLGKFWSTKIYHISNFPPINTGPYKYFKHPNYLVVIIEIAIIPLAFHLYYTAVIFSILNLIMLFVRIKEEDRVLAI